MDPISLKQFVEDFEEAVEDVEPGSLDAKTVFRDLDAWDSLAVLTVLAMLDAEYDVRIKATDLKSCETLEALWAFVNARR